MSQSEKFFRKSQQYFPGGVNSPVRAFRSVGGVPRFVKKGKGQYIWDEDGHRYLDFLSSWGPLILGHTNPKVARAIQKQAKLGTTYGAPTKNEIELAKLIQSAFPSIEQMRFVSSGTEAAMSAIRLARGVTGKSKIVKCDGCYHGHVDSMLIQAGSGATTFGIPDSAGIPEEVAKLTISIPYNDIKVLEEVFKRRANEIACFVLEPVPANMGVILPKPNYLNKVRQLCTNYGVILVFDEVISGFRLAFGGAQEYFNVEADLTCLGKIVGGGLPLAVFGGRKELMQHLAPEGKVYQAGTLSGNPVATAAGIAALKQLRVNNFYKTLLKKCEFFYSHLESEIRRRKVPVQLNRIGSCFTLFFNEDAVTDYASAKRSDTKYYAKFFHKLLSHGFYFAPSQFEANFISSVHSSADLAKTAAQILKSI